MDNLRQNIIKTAETAFVKYGIRSVSIDDLCNELHISKKTFYSEFRQKDDIVALVLESIIEKNRKADKECSESVPFENAIDFALAYKHPALIERKRKHEKFMRDLIKYYPEIHQAFLDGRKDGFRRFIFMNIQNGVKDGLYRSELGELDLDSPFVSIILNLFITMIDEELVPVKVDCYLRMVCNAEGLKYYEQKNV